MVFLWGIPWFLIFLEESCGHEQRYVISAPEVFYVGASENITIQAYGYTETFNAIVSIKSYPDRRLNYSSDSVNLSPENKFQNSANLKMQPIQLSEGKNSTSYVYLEVVSKHFSELKKMPVINNNGSLFNHTDKFLYMAQYSDGAFKEITNSSSDVKTTLKEGVGKIAAKYRHAVVKKCCHDGARRYKHHETCEERAARISIGPRCVQAFMECCRMAKPTPATDNFKISLLGKPAEAPTEIMRKRRDTMATLEEAVESQVAKYKHPVMKKCCYDGARRNDYETCEQRATHIKRRPSCVRAFSDCCATAKQIRDKIGYKPMYFHSIEFAQYYVVSAPKTFCVGASENVVIQAYGYTQPFAVTIAIKSYPDRSFTYTSEQVHLSPENEFQNSATLTILPEDLPGGPDAVAHVYLEVASVYFLKATKIPLRYDNGYLFIQTDRPVYDPNQPVKVRVYSLDEDQKPSQREVILTFIDPEGSEVTMDGKQSHTGIINFPDFKIPAYSEYGMWIVTAKYKEDFTTRGLAHFEIKMKRRALFLRKPRFSISIEPENYFITHKNFEDFKIIIKASSSYDENVTEADVSVFFGLRNDLGDRKDNLNEATQRTQLISGTAQINFNTSKAIENLPYKSLQDLNNKYLNILVKVKKHTGGLFEESNVTDVKYILSPYTLHLVAAPPPVKPGIPCSIKVQVKDTFDHSVGGITVALEPKVIDKTQEKRYLAPRKSTTSYDGVASFAVNIPTDVTALEFHVRTDDPDLPEEHQASNDYRVVAYSSPSQSFLSLNWTESYKSLLVGERFSITVTPKSPHVDKITHYNYLIVSKGKIVHFGREKKLPGSSHQILNLPTTQSMVPAAHLLVYYIIPGEQGAELVPDSICLSIEDKCSNQLQIHLLPNRDIRGAVSLIMDAQSESWVALTALNIATYNIQGRSKNPKERVKYDPSSHPTLPQESLSRVMWDKVASFLMIQPSSPEVLGALYKNDPRCGASGGRTSAEVFCLVGFTVLTNADTEDFQQNDGSCKKILRSRRSWEDLKDLVSQFRHPVIRKCCEDGIRPSRYSCGERAGRITIGPKCVDAFSQCCELQQNSSNKYVALGRTTGDVTFSTIRSKSVLENWLWNVYHVPKRSQQELAVPWLPTTWEIQGVSVSDKGLCIADVLHLQVEEERIQVTRLE